MDGNPTHREAAQGSEVRNKGKDNHYFHRLKFGHASARTHAENYDLNGVAFGF